MSPSLVPCLSMSQTEPKQPFSREIEPTEVMFGETKFEG